MTPKPSPQANNPPEPDPPAPPDDAAPPAPASPPRTYTEAELRSQINGAIQREKERSEARERKAREDAEAEKLREQGEFKAIAEQAQAKVRELEAALAARDLADLRREVAIEAGLPPALAARLHGDSREALLDDAKALAQLVQPAGPPEPVPAPGRAPSAPAAPANPRPAAPAGPQDMDQVIAEFNAHRAPVGRL